MPPFGGVKTTINNITDSGSGPSSGFSAAVSAGSGQWWYGSGVDGALSLAIDTNLALGLTVLQYSSIALNGHILSPNTGDFFLEIYCSGTLDLGSGGIIQGVTTGNGGAGGVNTNQAGISGGAGGKSRRPVFVYAKAITGTGSISAAGDAGANGNSTGSVVGGGLQATGTGGGQPAFNDIFLFGTSQFNGLMGSNTGGQDQAGGNAGTIQSFTRTNPQKSNFRQLLRMLFAQDANVSATAATTKYYTGSCGQGGASGACWPNAYVHSLGGGGGGAGGEGLFAPGGAGGAGGAGSGGGGGGGNGGGAGGGGAGGGFVLVVSDSIASTVTIKANGGNGGNGGAGQGGTTPGGGAGGGGGGGGIAICLCPSSSTPTVTAAGGAGGSSGGPTGSNGSSGSNGWSILGGK